MDGSRPVLKARIQRILRQIGIYDRLRESFAYDCYRRWRYGRPIRWRHNELLFYRSLLGGRSGGMLVFDVGAHRGQRTDVFLQLGARVIAIEPDASNQRLLARRYRGNRSRGNPVTVVGKAVSDASAAATLWVHAPGSGLNSLSQKWVRELGKDDRRFGSKVEFAGRQQVETTTLETLMNSFGVPCYIKIDVEGHEPSVLRGLKRPVPFLSFEVNLPEFLPEGLECIEILDRLAGDGRFNWSRDCQGALALREWPAGAGVASPLRGGLGGTGASTGPATARADSRCASGSPGPSLPLRCAGARRRRLKSSGGPRRTLLQPTGPRSTMGRRPEQALGEPRRRGLRRLRHSRHFMAAARRTGTTASSAAESNPRTAAQARKPMKSRHATRVYPVKAPSNAFRAGCRRPRRS